MNDSLSDDPHPYGALSAYGWNDTVAERYQSVAADDHLPVRIARVDRGGYMAATPSGVERCHPSSDPNVTAVTGDWGVVRLEPGFGLVLEEILPRTTAVGRLNPEGTGRQVIAANVDTMFVLHGVDRPHRVGRLERLCILAWDAGAEPVIVLTKTDLLGTGDAVIGLVEAIQEISKVIRGVDVHPVSSASGDGIAQLQRYLTPGSTIGLVGESGAGKSTLINRLVGEERQATGHTRSGDNKGRHTTTSRELVPIATGAVLLDTPGLRTIGMLGGEEGLARAYEDLEALFAACRFRDCSHDVEPGCAVTEALRRGELEASRWAGYQKLLKEMAHEARRADVRADKADSRESGKRLRKIRADTEEW